MITRPWISRLRSRRGRVLLVVAMIVAGVPATALGLSPDEASYPVTSFDDWTASPRQDGSDFALGQHTFQAGVVGALGRTADRYPDHYDPSSFTGEDGLERATDEGQAATDALLHNRPHLPYDHVGEAGYPELTPDWNANGTYGDPGDFDRDTDDTPDTASFLYPCLHEDGTFTHENAAGECATVDGEHAFKTGVVTEVRLANARGLLLDATVWIPGEAVASFDPASGTYTLREGESRPGIVFSNGVSSRQEYYSWFAMRMARAGYVVLTYDPAGQGESEGTGGALFEPRPDFQECPFAGACRDLQNVARWFVGWDVDPVVDLGASNDPLDPATYQEEFGAQNFGHWRNPWGTRHDPAANPTNPALPVLDTSRIALAGNSMGAISTLHYLNRDGTGFAGDALPPVVAAVILSGAAPTKASVPIQFQTSDYDGSPTLVGPGVAGVALGFQGEGIGYGPIKDLYNELRDTAARTQPLELVVLEGGTHTDHVAVPYVPRTLWSISLAARYALGWLDCHVRSDAGACTQALQPHEHLSRAFASEAVPADAHGPGASRCITVPDRASLNQRPDAMATALAGSPPYDCTPD